MGRARGNVADRFFAKVAVADCWEWQASRYPQGYGQFTVDDRPVPAHRWCYQYLIGPIAEGLTLDHLCRNRACVNPDHLEPVTNRANILRGVGPTALNAKKTYCKNGHEFTEANTYRIRGGRRNCRACRQAAGARRTARLRAARESGGAA